MKKETLEEAAERYANKKGDIPTTELEDAIFKQGFIDGAKWQQEQDKNKYSEEDMREAYKSCYTPFSFDRIGDLEQDFKKWFEQFKKQ